MVEDNLQSTEECLSHAKGLVPNALSMAKQVKVFPQKWKLITSKLQQIPSQLSRLSTHPCFSKNPLCKEQIQAFSNAINEAIELAKTCAEGKYQGKLRMQSDLDSLVGKLDLNLRDCGLMIKTGVLSEVTFSSGPTNVKELLARLQIGDLEAKHKALDSLVEIMKEDEKNMFAIIGPTNIAALIRLQTSTSIRIREKAAAIICSLSESGVFDNWLVSENVVPSLVRLVDLASSYCKEKATISLKKLSASADTSRLIVESNGIKPLIEICMGGDSVSQAAAACTLRNISFVPELRQPLHQEGIVKAMVSLLDSALFSGSKEHAAECLRNLTSSSEELRNSLVSQGGITGLLKYLDGSLPQEPAVGVLKNLSESAIFVDELVSSGVLLRLANVLESGSLSSRKLGALAICGVCISDEIKRLVGEIGCVAFLVRMLDEKSDEAREIGARVLASLMVVKDNCEEVRRDGKGIPNLVGLLDPSPCNGAKKHAVSCLGMVSSSVKCRRVMVSYGAIGYLKKLVDMDVAGAKKLLERLEMGRFRSLFSK